jgi:hypothetical protein
VRTFGDARMLDIGKQNVVYFEGNKKVNIIGNVILRGDLVTVTTEGGLVVSIFKEVIVRMEEL